MRISSEWISEFVPVPPLEQLEEALLMAGLGIEARDEDRFELEVTSNRGDWLSAIGLAREVAAVTEARFRLPSPDVDEDGPRLEGRAFVEITDASDCQRFTLRLVEGITIGPSPDWMQKRLADCGVRAINSVVDVTNYVMLEWGQPLHAYDADKIAEGYFVVRRAREGEVLETLDGAKHELTPEMLLIAGKEGPLGVAGVMGGAASEVTESTTSILLESAHFTPNVVRRSAHLLGMHTDASKRFERWVDPNGCRRAADRAAQLIAQLCGGEVAAGCIDRYVAPVMDVTVSLRVSRCNAVLGLKLSPDQIRNCLERLGLKVANHDDGFKVSVPTWRRDIEREIDLIEEVARIYGYGRIPTTLHAGANTAAGRSIAGRLEDRARSAMLRAGLTEIITTSLSNEPSHTTAGQAVEAAVRMRNPLSEDYTLLRTSLIPGLLDVLKRNRGRRLRGFELGKIYLAQPAAELPYEKRMLGLALSNAHAAPHWQPAANPPVDFFSVKAVLESVLREFGSPVPWFNPTQHPSFHPGRCASVAMDGQEIGVMGEIHPLVAEEWGITERAYVAEIDFDALVRHIALVKRNRDFSKLPPADREIALLVDDSVPAVTLVETARHAGGELLEFVRVFDLYQGANLPAGKKSVALSLRFRSTERTLERTEVDEWVQKIVAAENAVGAVLRS